MSSPRPKRAAVLAPWAVPVRVDTGAMRSFCGGDPRQTPIAQAMRPPQLARAKRHANDLRGYARTRSRVVRDFIACTLRCVLLALLCIFSPRRASRRHTQERPGASWRVSRKHPSSLLSSDTPAALYTRHAQTQFSAPRATRTQRPRAAAAAGAAPRRRPRAGGPRASCPGTCVSRKVGFLALRSTRLSRRHTDDKRRFLMQV